MTDPVLDIADYLNAATGDLGWLMKTSDNTGPGTLFQFDMPPTPDKAVAVLRYEGRAPDETFGNSFQVRHPRIQIMIRDKTSKSCFDISESIIKRVGVVKDQVINGTKYQRIKIVTEGIELGPDSSGRQRVTVNLEVSYEDHE